MRGRASEDTNHSMIAQPEKSDDPMIWSCLLALAFGAACSIRLATPASPYFDEVHYIPAAKAWLENGAWLNREHPPLGKYIIAAGIALFGDNALGWRIFSVLAGVVTLFAAMRAIWYASLSRFAVISYGVLLGTGFLLFVHSRIAMLDIFMLAFFAVALWQFSGAVRKPEQGRRRLAIAGIALGLSMGSKWNVALAAMLPGIAFLIARLSAGRRRLLTSQRGIPVPGVSLAEAAIWLGLLPLTVYWLTYWPAYNAPENPLLPGGFTGLHETMLAMQSSVKQPHTYQSVWSEWLLNIRAIWYLYDPVDGAQRGVLLIGNPLTALLAIPAMLWAFWAGITQRRWDALAIAVMFTISLGMWAFADKPVQFYYHYLLPSMFLFAALALALDEFWKRDLRWIAVLALLGATAMFAWFYPILSAAPLDGKMAFQQWMWLDSWR